MNETIMILGMMTLTFGIRYILLALADRFVLPDVVESALKYVPPAVLTAITFPAVLMPRGQIDITMQNAYLFGALAAVGAGCFFRRNSLLASIGMGLLVFFLWRYGLTLIA
ncbi:MAG: hypothetical protein B6241_07890 [Spirochaetaceae bacterium 4572_59]|nr:MAG: hypothetical protein B6241_07890 [Spirochaetaceae bacterium 4572_59]